MKLLAKYIHVTLIALLAGIFLASCSSSPGKKLNSLINKAIRSNNDVNETECKEMKDFVLANKDNLKEYILADGKVDIEKLNQLILQIAAKRRSKEPAPELCKEKDPNEITKRPHFDIYIENSLSMDGYVNGNTDFEDAITRLLIDIKDYVRDTAKMHINFINSKVISAQGLDIQNFANLLEPGSKTYNVGGTARGVSNLNQVFQMALKNTKTNIAILVSDCVYSLGKNNDTQGTLNIEKNRVMQHFVEKLYDSTLATICLKLNSRFTGTYYNKNDKPSQIENINRPYYIWFMGPKEWVEDFYTTIHPETDLKGYKSSFVLFPNAAEKEPFFTILKETGKVGRFKSDRESRDFVRSIKSISYEDDVFQFSVAVDLKGIPVDSSYITDNRNFKLTDGFTLVGIEKLNRNSIAPRDWKSVEQTTATHLLTIRTSSQVRIQDLSISLLRQIPAWVKGTSSEDDTNILTGLESAKTFGLQYLIDGVNEAYKKHSQSKYPSFFTFTININR